MVVREAVVRELEGSEGGRWSKRARTRTTNLMYNGTCPRSNNVAHLACEHLIHTQDPQ